MVPEENPDLSLMVRASLIEWLRTDAVDGCALVRFSPGLGPSDWGLSTLADRTLADRGLRTPLEKGILIPRHAGFSLLRGGPYPMSAHVIMPPSQVRDDRIIGKDSLKSIFWVTVIQPIHMIREDQPGIRWGQTP